MMRRKAFTLVELLVVISIMSLLMAILMPALAKARQHSKNVVCLSNLRQMAILAHIYATSNDDYYPLAYTATSLDFTTMTSVQRCWDFTTVHDWSTSSAAVTVKPGILWEANGQMEIYQCPSFKGPSNTSDDPFTGYNYNTSYIGSPAQSAKIIQVKHPSSTAIFGDGEFVDGDKRGANKYMRAPWPNPRDGGFSSDQWAGTQGYRHMGKTNVAFCDGRVQSWKYRYKDTLSEHIDKIGDGVGFLSEDNSLYDLE